MGGQGGAEGPLRLGGRLLAEMGGDEQVGRADEEEAWDLGDTVAVGDIAVHVICDAVPYPELFYRSCDVGRAICEGVA